MSAMMCHRMPLKADSVNALVHPKKRKKDSKREVLATI